MNTALLWTFGPAALYCPCPALPRRRRLCYRIHRNGNPENTYIFFWGFWVSREPTSTAAAATGTCVVIGVAGRTRRRRSSPGDDHVNSVWSASASLPVNLSTYISE